MYAIHRELSIVKIYIIQVINSIVYLKVAFRLGKNVYLYIRNAVSDIVRSYRIEKSKGRSNRYTPRGITKGKGNSLPP